MWFILWTTRDKEGYLTRAKNKEKGKEIGVQRVTEELIVDNEAQLCTLLWLCPLSLTFFYSVCVCLAVFR